MKEDVRQLLGQNTLRVIALCDGVTGVYANVKPDDKTWSIAQVLQHMALTDKVVYTALRWARAKDGPSPDVPDEAIREALVTNPQKREAPESTLPAADVTLADAMHNFKYWRDALIEYMNHAGADFEAGYTLHSHIGLLNRRQWILFSIYHSERHIQQILRLKSYLSPVN